MFTGRRKSLHSLSMFTESGKRLYQETPVDKVGEEKSALRGRKNILH